MGYLMYPGQPSGSWYDVTANIENSQRHLVLGGEASMWNGKYAAAGCFWMQDFYGPFCPNPKFTLKPGQKNYPYAQWMSDAVHDDVFSSSMSNTVWPRAAAAAGSFWHYLPDLSRESFDALIAAHGERLAR